jgi:hypothetical protein
MRPSQVRRNAVELAQSRPTILDADAADRSSIEVRNLAAASQLAKASVLKAAN